MPRIATAFLITLAVCFGAQTLALRLAGGRTVKSESNYFSSIARLQTAHRGGPHVMLLGSSLTGRLADRGETPPGIANLGCDGGSAVITLRAIDRGLLPAAPIIIVEGNTLAYELDGRGHEIAEALDGTWFQAGYHIPQLGATARPTAFAYSWLMARKEGAADSIGAGPLPDIAHTVSTAPIDGNPSPPENAEPLVRELTAIFQKLGERGTRVIILMLPPGEPHDSRESRFARSLAGRGGAGWWDLAEELPAGSVATTDGRHLDAAGARLVNQLIARQFPAP